MNPFDYDVLTGAPVRDGASSAEPMPHAVLTPLRDEAARTAAAAANEDHHGAR
ncbi:hypothetical protein GIY62_00980 [Burkholderia plantarii]|uniref:hypothetical protein n=1 Tax=Burkholderia plantarii TaxID=41899 RepID=UPI00272BEAB9|nr:hypothetical protein [Burkholderia plantarii]WLE59311.1 hypothetical protein GIY62_00980 [Burkholderia plantarii]